MDIHIKKAGRNIPVPDLDVAKVAKATGLTEDVCRYIWNYGWRQSLNDAASSIKADSEGAGDKAFALAVKRADNLKAGNLRAERETDAVRAEALRMATVAIAKRPDMKKASPKAIREKALGYIDVFMERAAERVAEQAELSALING